jgi:hypothetical protein
MEVPSLKGELRDLIARYLELYYVSESCKDGIRTENRYQSVRLGDLRTKGVRSIRDEFLDQVDFAGKKVLDLGSNLGELSRGARARGAALVDGYEYDPFFVELATAINTYGQVSRVSQQVRDITDPASYRDHYDIVLAFSVFVYVEPVLEQLASVTDGLLVLETHRLEDNFEDYYVRVVGKHFPHYVILGESDWDVRLGGENDRRAIVAFAKDELSLLGGLKEAEAGSGPANMVRAAVAHRSGHMVPPRHVAVDLTRPPRQALQQRFFMMFRFDSLEDLFDAVDRMEIDVNALSKSRESKNLGSEGWVYWFLFTKGYVQYMKAGEVEKGNVYFDYLTRHYFDQGHDPGSFWDLNVHDLAVERVARRYRDLDWLREQASARSDPPPEAKPARVTVDDRPRDPPLHLYEIGAEPPIPVRHIDGWHRLFSARLSGLVSFPCEADPENLHAKPIRGQLEGLAFDGTRVRITGWAFHPELPVTFELRESGHVLARVGAIDRPDVAQVFPHLGLARASGFAIDLEWPRPADVPVRFDLIVMHEIDPVGVLRLLHMPGETTLAPTLAYELLRPVVRRRALAGLSSVLLVGTGAESLAPTLVRMLPTATVSAVGPGELSSAAPGSADLVIAHGVLPFLRRDEQLAFLDAARDAVSEEGFVAATVQGELIRPYLGSPDTASELDADGISDRGAGEGGTVQTEEYARNAYSSSFEIIDFAVGRVGNRYDLVLLRKR